MQDLGRPGWAHLGVPRSGALDAPALRLANRLVGNAESAAGLETTLLGCAVRFARPAVVAVTGATARCGSTASPGVRGGRRRCPPGRCWTSAAPSRGVRSYLAVAGGIDVEPVLGSRSTDTLSGLGPAPLGRRTRCRSVPPLGLESAEPGPAGPESAGRPSRRISDTGAEIVLRVRFGPRDDWFADVDDLLSSAYTISPVSNRIGARLAGPAADPRARPANCPARASSSVRCRCPPTASP